MTRRDLPSDLWKAANVLIRTPYTEHGRNEACGDLLTVTDVCEEDVLIVTLQDTPDAILDRWRTHTADLPPANIAIVTVNETERSTRATVDSTASIVDPSLASVKHPRNLTSLGVRITEQLSAWEDTGNRSVLCFDSLTTLLQYVDLDVVFQFLHTLKARITISEGVAHYHVDPDVVDTRAVNTITSLMDAVVTIEDDEWAISSRDTV